MKKPLLFAIALALGSFTLASAQFQITPASAVNGGGVFTTVIKALSGVDYAYTFQDDTDTGFKNTSAGIIDVQTDGATAKWRFSESATGLVIGSGFSLRFGATVGAPDWGLARSSGGVADMESGHIMRATGGGYFAAAGTTSSFRTTAAGAFYSLANTFAVNTAPTIASGGCTSPSISNANGTKAFTILIGTSCAGVQSITLTFPASTSRWTCNGYNNTSDAAQQSNYIVALSTNTTTVVFTSYDRVTGVKEDFTASNVYSIQCDGQ